MKKKNICRKQHYIPQMLLRGFSKVNTKISVHKKDSTYETNIKDTAAMRDFYSPADDMSLDDVLTDHEASSLQKHMSTLRKLPNDSEVFKNIASEVIHFFNIRTKFFRDIFSSFAKDTVTCLQDSLTREEFKKHTKSGAREAALQNISDYYDKNKEKIQINKKLFLKIATNYFDKNPTIIEKSLDQTYDNFNSIVDHTLSQIPNIVKDGHTKGLAQVYESRNIPEFYSSFTWVIKKDTNYNFILPDCIAVVITEEGSSPVGFQSEATSCVILFPIAKDILLVGKKGDFKVDISKFNHYAAENTSEIFFCHPQFTPPNDLQEMIGNKMSKLTFDEGKKAVENYLKKK